MRAEEVFFSYVDDYLDEVEDLSYTGLENRQEGFHASLAFGAAGIAYTCWYAGLIFEEEELFALAERWLGAAVERVHERLAFLVPLSEIRERPASHFLYGEAGLAFVRVLVAHTRDDGPARALALARFLELARLSLAGSPEFYNGAAGTLAATALLFEHVGDPRLQDLGEELARHLVGRAAPGLSEVTLWPELRGLGLAHGSAGPHLALLLWAAAAGSPLPAWFAPSLENLLGSVVHDPGKLCPNPSYHSWLCNGFAGLAVLGARGHQILGGPALLEAAAGATRIALGSLTDQPDLCCGRAGAAFACLSLAREDPGGPWRQHAGDLALSTLLVEREEWETAGLYGGEAAIPCLALNLYAGLDAGPPALDRLDLRLRG